MQCQGGQRGASFTEECHYLQFGLLTFTGVLILQLLDVDIKYIELKLSQFMPYPNSEQI